MNDSEISAAPMKVDAGTASMARLLFVSYDFPPSAMPGAASCAEIVRYLPLYGWEPTVLTAKERHYETLDPRRQPPVPVLRTPAPRHPIAIYSMARERIRKRTQSSPPARRPLHGAQSDGALPGLTTRT